ncbi:NAD(P)/FAD-dependent oxidoreductase [Gordonia caeni]|uniref:FAD-dependent oxidoreductase n=1 Tax=Gordonia caeni TaxID=1007097 RepID=A0ABP7PSF1_9ACTN
MTSDSRPTVVVIGAGLSGLIAARALVRAGIEVAVLEAADRAGGRALSETTVLGSRVDLGGQWLGHDHHAMAGLAAETGTTVFAMHSGRLPALIERRRPLSPLSPGVLIAALATGLAGALAAAGRPAVSNDRPLSAWLSRVPTRRARRLLEALALISWTADLDRLSPRAMTAMIRSQGGVRTMLSTTGGAQDSLVVEGVGAIVDALAGELGPRIHLGAPVTRIDRDAGGVTVHTDGRAWRAAEAIVTVPAPVAARIEHRPPLPAARTAVEEGAYMGSVYKAIAVYDSPFWRATAEAECVILDEPARAVFDTSPPDGPGHLCTLVAGPAARALDGLDPAERRAALLDPLADRLGAEVARPAGWHEKSWHLDPHVGGGYLALPEPGSTAGFLPHDATPAGRVHWAGAETSGEHPGYLEGAVLAGERAAAEVAAALAG